MSAARPRKRCAGCFGRGQPGVRSCQQAISVGLVIGGFYLFDKGDITMGAIIAIVMLAGRAMSPIGQFAFHRPAPANR